MDLQQKANKLRQDILKMIYAAEAGHPGGSLSVIDILTTLYYGGFVSYNAQNPKDDKRDYVILSKAHASPAMYAVLADLGFFAPEEIFSFRQIDSKLQGHVCTTKVEGIDISGGSLGQGLSVANGIALGRRDRKVFCVLGDGELQEGQVWEAAMTSAHYKLDNLVAFVDRNTLQIDGETEKVMAVGNVAKKFEAFDWEVFECDGHDFEELQKTIEKAIAVKGKPAVIVAKTVKGKGVSFMENNAGWHGKAPNDEQFNLAIEELSKN